MRNKRAVSEIISTVLIVVLAIAAVGIVATAVIPMIKKNLEVSGECSAVQRDLTIVTERGYTCKNSTNSTWVQIKMGAGDYELSSIKVLGYTSEGFSIEGLKITENLGKNREIRPLVTDLEMLAKWGDVEEVELFPVIKIGNTLEDCEGTGRVKLADCA